MTRFHPLSILLTLCLLVLVAPRTVWSQALNPTSSTSPERTPDENMPQSQNATGELTVTADVITASETVRPGDIVTYTVRLKRSGDTGPLDAELQDILPWPLRLAGRVDVRTITPPVGNSQVKVKFQEDENQQTNTEVHWQGTLGADAEVALRFPVQAYALCDSGEASPTIVNVVQASASGDTPVETQTEFSVACPQVYVDDIIVGLQPLDSEGNASLLETFTIEELAGVRVTLTNPTEEQVILGYYLDADYIGETEKNIDPVVGVADQPQQILPSSSSETDIIAILVAFSQITLHPGEQRTFDVWTDMRPAASWFDQLEDAQDAQGHTVPSDGTDTNTDTNDDELPVDFSLYYTLLPRPVQDYQIDLNDDSKVRQVSRRIYIRPWELGDAPDSANHDGIPMTAYPGVQANFPTVFDSTVSTPQGPAHVRSHHFHLGGNLDFEADADIGTAPNIEPATDSANQDQFDDGALPHAWNLTNCRPTSVVVELFISPVAAAWFQNTQDKGYLNGWLDANRDGDWEDTNPCQADDLSLPAVALEHFMIDHMIDVAALGPGLHRVTVNTGRVPWPADQAQQPTWLRLTLSERPSAKMNTVNGIDYGDGRGHTLPFRTGETEDYLLRPPGAPSAGSDMAVAMRGYWQPALSTAQVQSAVAEEESSLNYEEIKWLIQYSNQGTAPSENVSLVFEIPETLRDQQAEISLVPNLRSNAVEVGNEQIIVDLDTVAPGKQGWLVVSFFRPEIDDEVVVAYQAAATIVSTQDIDPDNNSASFKVEIEGVTQGVFGFKSPNAPFAVHSGTTNSSELILQGLVPTSLLLPAVQFWVHSTLATSELVTSENEDDALASALPEPGKPITATVDGNGHWTHTFTDLPDGVYQFAVGDAAACDTHSAKHGETVRSLHGYGTVCGLAVVDSTLQVDPISLTFTDSNGRVFLPDTLEWSQGDWRAILSSGRSSSNILNASNSALRLSQSYTISIDADPNAELFFGITGFGSFETKLVESDVPGRYQGGFSIEDGGAAPGAASTSTLSLRVESENWAVQYDGELAVEDLAQVKDATTGSGLAGATVTLMAATPMAPTADSSALIFTPWDGSSYGQPNPVTTDAEGNYTLVAPANLYQLYVTAEGYQPYRTEMVSAGGLLTETIDLWPMVDAEADHVIALTDVGFEPAFLPVKPHSVVEFVNTSEEATRVLGADFNSGLLLPGESFILVADESGEMALQTDADLTRRGVLLIDPDAGDQFMFLPITTR